MATINWLQLTHIEGENIYIKHTNTSTYHDFIKIRNYADFPTMVTTMVIISGVSWTSHPRSLAGCFIVLVDKIFTNYFQQNRLTVTLIKYFMLIILENSPAKSCRAFNSITIFVYPGVLISTPSCHHCWYSYWELCTHGNHLDCYHFLIGRYLAKILHALMSITG